MSRPFSIKAFDEAFDQRIVKGQFNEIPEYYPRYKSRYLEIIKLYSKVAGPPPIDLLDIGGGQFGTLASALWGDRATMADVGGKNYDYLRSQGIRPVEWNLCDGSSPFDNEFDAVIFSEVIEHLPLPGHVILERLKKAMRPGGVMICTTPNLYRLRNVVYMAIGKGIYDNFRMPTTQGLGHVIEYSRDHLYWQFEQAGFVDIEITFRQFHHIPNQLPFRLAALAGYPLFAIPRFRDILVVQARKPGLVTTENAVEPRVNAGVA
jgi:2-polyprenyl-3-methyl-5-hydroxy-6-metoxy-1,4-benzoquinol methylase